MTSPDMASTEDAYLDAQVPQVRLSVWRDSTLERLSFHPDMAAAAAEAERIGADPARTVKMEQGVLVGFNFEPSS